MGASVELFWGYKLRRNSDEMEYILSSVKPVCDPKRHLMMAFDEPGTYVLRDEAARRKIEAVDAFGGNFGIRSIQVMGNKGKYAGTGLVRVFPEIGASCFIEVDGESYKAYELRERYKNYMPQCVLNNGMGNRVSFDLYDNAYEIAYRVKLNDDTMGEVHVRRNGMYRGEKLVVLKRAWWNRMLKK